MLVLESGRISAIGKVADLLGASCNHCGAWIAGVKLVNGTVGTDGSQPLCSRLPRLPFSAIRRMDSPRKIGRAHV